MTSNPSEWQSIPVYSDSEEGSFYYSPVDISLRGKLDGAKVPAGSQVYAKFSWYAYDDAEATGVDSTYSGGAVWGSVVLYVNGEEVKSDFGALEVTLDRVPVAVADGNGYFAQRLTYAKTQDPFYVYVAMNGSSAKQYRVAGEPLTLPVLSSGAGSAAVNFGIYFGYKANQSSGDSQAPALTVTGNVGIKAAGDLKGPNVPDGADVDLSTAVLTSGAAFDDIASSVPNRISDIFEIKLMVNGKEVHNGFGELTLSMPVDPAYNGHVVVIHHRHQDGSISTSRAVAKNGYVTFTVTDLSAFALSDGGLPEEETGGAAQQTTDKTTNKVTEKDSSARLPQTGDSAPFLALIALASAAAGALLFARFKLRSERQVMYTRLW